MCRKWAKCAASGSSGLQAATQSSHQTSLPQTVFWVRETAAIFEPSSASCLVAIRLTRVTHFGQHCLACRLTQSLPQTLCILRETLGKWIQADTATCNTLDPLEIHSTHLVHLQHTCPTWPTCNTLDTLGPLAPHLPHLTWDDYGSWEGSGSSMASALQVGQVCCKWVKCIARGSSASQVRQLRRQWVKCVASGPGVFQEQVCQVGQVCCKWGKW